MSSQPSTVDNIRSTASAATRNIADSIDPAENEQESRAFSDSKKSPQDAPLKEQSFKNQLDETARSGPGAMKKQESLGDKVASYIPSMSSLQKSIIGENSGGKERDEEPQSNTSQLKRPDHDLHVEEFLKEQYKSKSEADMPNVGEDK